MTTTVSPETIGIIVLAAGAASRFGSDKRRALMSHGNSLLETTLGSIPATFTRRLLVLKPGDDELAQQFRQDWQICWAQQPDAGLANSLASGIALARDWEGCLIALGDMPYISPLTYTTLQQALSSHAMVVPTCRGQRGNPAGFRQCFFAEIEKLQGDQGARSLLSRHADQCREIETGDEGILRDVDHPDMLESL